MTTTSSSEHAPVTTPVPVPGRRVIAAVDAGSLPTATVPDLRSGHWTRHTGSGTGRGSSALGDRVTEDLLGAAVEEARRVARSQGFSAGWADGVRAAREEAAAGIAQQREAAVADERRRAAEHDTAVAALRRAADELARCAEQARAQVADQAVALALAVTEATLGAAARAQLPDDVVRRALAAADAEPGTRVVVRLAPPTHAGVDRSALPDGVVLRADAALGPADALVELDDTVVDLRVDSALRRVREVLS